MPNSPTLLDAFLDARLIASAAPAATRQRNAACLRILLAELTLLGRGVFASYRLPSGAHEEAANVIALRLAQGGPRRGLAQQPTSDARVRAFLTSALHNQARDQLRAAKRHAHASLDDVVGETQRARHEQVADPTAIDAEGALVDRDVAAKKQAKLDAANAWLDAQTQALIIAKEARRRGMGTTLADTLALLARAAAGEIDVDALAASRLPPGADARQRKRERNAIDARFKRARRTLDAWISAAMAGLDQDPSALTAGDTALIRLLLRKRVSLR